MAVQSAVKQAVGKLSVESKSQSISYSFEYPIIRKAEYEGANQPVAMAIHSGLYSSLP